MVARNKDSYEPELLITGTGEVQPCVGIYIHHKYRKVSDPITIFLGA